MVRNRNIVVSKAGKGDVKVAMYMYTSYYLELAHKHLGDASMYQLLCADPTSELAVRFNSYLDECLRNNHKH